jgi:hypothetical protein
MNDDREILDLLREIISGEDRSTDIARHLNGVILAAHPDADDDPRFEQLMFVLACYRPGGGEYLYNAEQLADECRRVLARLSEPPTDGCTKS